MKDMTEEEDALRTRTPHTLVKSCITNEDSTYTRQVIHRYALVKSCITNEDSTCIHSSSHALRTRTPHTLVKSYVTNEDSKHTRQFMHYERGLHMYRSSSHTSRTRTPHVYTRQVIHYERGLPIHWSNHAIRTRTPHTLVRSCITNVQKMAHLLSCRQLDDACTADDLATVTERAKACTRKWEKIV